MMFADWCSQYIKTCINQDNAHFFRLIPLLSPVEQEKIMILPYDNLVRVVYSDWVAYIKWHTDGYIESVRYHKSGSPINHWRRWYPTGQLQEESLRYKCDLRIGHWREWYSNGQIRADGDYESGYQIGHWRTWYPTGQQMSESIYVDTRVSYFHYWDETGHTIRVICH